MSRTDRRLAKKAGRKMGAVLPNLQAGLSAVQQLQGAFGDAKQLTTALQEALGKVTGMEHELARQRYVTLRLFQMATGAPQIYEDLENQYRAEFDKLHEAGEGL